MMTRLFFFVTTVLAAAAQAAPVWRYAANPELKLFGGVLIGDEHGTYADERLPEGWVWPADENQSFSGEQAGGPSAVVEKPSSGIASGAQRPEGPEKAAKVKAPSVVTLRATEAKAALEGDGLRVAFVAADTNPPSKEQAFTIQR